MDKHLKIYLLMGIVMLGCFLIGTQVTVFSNVEAKISRDILGEYFCSQYRGGHFIQVSKLEPFTVECEFKSPVLNWTQVNLDVYGLGDLELIGQQNYTQYWKVSENT